MLTDGETQSSSFTESQDDSQEKRASKERCSRQKLERLSLNSNYPSRKRSRGSDQGDSALEENESPQKRRLRGRV